MRLTPDKKTIAVLPLALLLFSSLNISGCSGVLSSDQPARQIYLLQPKSLVSASPDTTETVELHFSLTAIPGLDTDRIIAVDSDARLSGYANARWPDFLPEVLSSVIRRSLLSSGQFSIASQPNPSEPNTWTLALEVQQFNGVQRTRGITERVSGQIEAMLTCGDKTHRIQLDASNPVPEERLAVVVRAHQSVLDEMTSQLWEKMSSVCR